VNVDRLVHIVNTLELKTVLWIRYQTYTVTINNMTELNKASSRVEGDRDNCQ